MTLLFHDGELADVRALLGNLGTPFVERRGILLPEDHEQRWGVVVGTPQRILDAHILGDHSKPTQIAVCDRDSRTLRNSLRRAGIQLMVRRPVHPAALRALLLHALYRGPEKRRNTRVSIGAPIRFRAGWRQRPAVLADLSIGGCRLITPYPVAAGKAITLSLPTEIGGGKAFQLKASVLRRLGPEGQEPSLSARFGKLKAKQIEQLKRAIAAHTDGPATVGTEPVETRAAPPAEPPPSRPDARPIAASTPNDVVSEEMTPPTTEERRSEERHGLDRRVIALGEEATRVLMGRDLSPGGMRVNPNPLLTLGADVRLAIHVGEQNVPLVVKAKVHRDDGERGVVLRFHGLEASAAKMLNAMLESLPIIEHDESRKGIGMIVSEILGDTPEATS